MYQTDNSGCPQVVNLQITFKSDFLTHNLWIKRKVV